MAIAKPLLNSFGWGKVLNTALDVLDNRLAPVESAVQGRLSEASILNQISETVVAMGGGGGGGGDVSGKIDKVETFTNPPGSPLFRRDLNYTLATNQKNLHEVAVNGTVRMWLNEWGALRGRVPYGSFADSLARAIVEPGDYTSVSGTGGNAFEIVDRRKPDGVGRQSWGRRWEDGSLIRNGIKMSDVYVTNDVNDPNIDKLPSGTMVMVFGLEIG